MRRRLATLLLLVGATGSLLAAWSLHRVSNVVLMADRAWPRPFPYPDRALWALNDWYDARHAVPPGFIKLHGELPRVRLTLGFTLAASGLVLASGLARHAADRRRRRHGRPASAPAPDDPAPASGGSR